MLYIVHQPLQGRNATDPPRAGGRHLHTTPRPAGTFLRVLIILPSTLCLVSDIQWDAGAGP